ncbi:sigma-70 family RNA polymerase sigma factor [Saccharothrix longispora]|uniref:sigma-70 family RNA polymerase sigma factor n=1 Tax=Saccharothrix longispora TaxID=33920 RepID=UPI0028FD28C0|nr:sigma-70 family RNA polymerase sigma factor [Saccharothrix longispora]MDU0294587.1 sigma-70 family RNA polymerase sigma factor [Saccharothrix longispora]
MHGVARHRRSTSPPRDQPWAELSLEDELIRRLYQEFGSALLGHAMRLTGSDRQWAEDIVQETLVRAWRNAEKLERDPVLLRSWLFTVARRLVIDDRRKRSVRPQESELTPSDEAPVRDEADRTLAAIVVAEAMNGLTEEHREAILETYLRDRTVGEAAAVLGVPPGTVKSRVYYALRALRRALQDRG